MKTIMLTRTSGIITYTASGVAMIGGLTMTDWAALIGALVALLSFAVNVYFKRKHYRLALVKARSADDDLDPEADA